MKGDSGFCIVRDTAGNIEEEKGARGDEKIGDIAESRDQEDWVEEIEGTAKYMY